MFGEQTFAQLRTGFTLHAALQNKSAACSGSQVTNSTVMKLHESDNRDRITVKMYKELTYIIIQYRLAHDDEREGRVGLGWYGYCTDLLVGATNRHQHCSKQQTGREPNNVNYQQCEDVADDDELMLNVLRCHLTY